MCALSFLETHGNTTHFRPIRNANDPSVLENGTVLNRFAGYLAFGVVALVVENAILADTIGRVEVVALIAIGLNVFFFVRAEEGESNNLQSLALPQHRLLRHGLAHGLDRQRDNFW